MSQLPSRYGDGGAASFPSDGYDPVGGNGPPYFSALGAYSTPAPGMAPPVVSDDKTKHDKEAIRSHPLFPLLTCLFEKCELATCTPREPRSESASSFVDVVSAASFKEDIDEFTKTIQAQKTYYEPNKQLDDLMLQAITMLRFHLLELEKVHELCDNFCSRYVGCLKEKLPFEIVGEERASSSAGASSHSPPPHGGCNSVGAAASPALSTPINSHYQPPPYEPQSVPLPESTSAMSQPPPHHSLEPMVSSSLALSSAYNAAAAGMGSGDTGGMAMTMDSSLMPSSMPAPPPGHSSHNSSAALSPSASSSGGGARNGSTPVYETASAHHNPNPASMDSAETGDDNSSLCGSNDDGRESVMSDGQGGGKRKVPKVFSKEAITKFRAWLFQNLTHPYPSEEQKKQLANDTGLTILQVNNWFINARRRIVQPMIDQSNRNGRPNVVNVFKNRRRKDSGTSSPEGGGPGAVSGTSSVSGIDSAAASYGVAAAVAASDASCLMPPMGVYPPELYMRGASSMFSSFPPYNPATAAMAGNPAMFMPNMGMFAPSGAALSASWMDPLALSTTQMD